MADDALSGQTGGQGSQPAAGQEAQGQKGGPGQGSGQDGSSRQAAGAGGRTGIKPIPPRQSKPPLPAESLGFERNAPDADIAEFLEPGGQKRDPMTGRFMPSIADEMAQAAEAERQQAQADGDEGEGERPGKKVERQEAKPGEKPPEQKPPLPADQDPAQTKVLYRGKEVTLAQIEQRHKSLEGQFKSLTEERDHGWRAGWAWKERADRAEARIAQLEAGRTQPGSGGNGARAEAASAPAAGTDLPTVDQVLAEIDFNRFEQAALQEKDGGLPAAGKQLASDILKVVLEKVVPVLRAQQEAAFEPIQDMQAGEQIADSVQGLIEQFGSYKNMDGTQAFPEFRDPAVLHEIAATWVNSGGDPEDTFTASGMLRALMNYRSIKAMFPGADPAAVAASTSGEEAGANPSRQQPTSALAASVPGDTRGGHLPPNSGRSTQDPATRRFVNALTKVDLVDPVLGFRKNPANAHVGARD